MNKRKRGSNAGRNPPLGERARVRGTAIGPEPIRALHPCTNGKGQRRGAIPSPWGEGEGEGDRDSRQPGSSPEKASCPPLADASWGGGPAAFENPNPFDKIPNAT